MLELRQLLLLRVVQLLLEYLDMHLALLVKLLDALLHVQCVGQLNLYLIILSLQLSHLGQRLGELFLRQDHLLPLNVTLIVDSSDFD